MQHPPRVLSLAPADSAAGRGALWLAVAAAGLALLLAAGLAAGGGTEVPRAADAAGYARDQAVLTISALGYRALGAPTQDRNRVWHADAEKDGASWHVQISPYGVVRVHAAGRPLEAQAPAKYSLGTGE